MCKPLILLTHYHLVSKLDSFTLHAIAVVKSFNIEVIEYLGFSLGNPDDIFFQSSSGIDKVPQLLIAGAFGVGYFINLRNQIENK